MLTPVQQQMYWQMMLAPAGVVLYPWIQLITSLAAQVDAPDKEETVTNHDRPPASACARGGLSYANKNAPVSKARRGRFRRSATTYDVARRYVYDLSFFSMKK
jgi:hypothetical protein